MFKNVINKITEYVLNILIFLAAVALILAGIYAIQTKILNKNYADIFGYSVFQIATGSMSPTMEKDDIVLVKLNDSINENDIIVFKDGNDLITHRIVKINEDKITTKGDANNSEDKQISNKDVIGKVIKSFNNVTILKQILYNPVVKIIILMAIIIVIVVIIFQNKNNKEEKIDEDKEN